MGQLTNQILAVRISNSTEVFLTNEVAMKVKIENRGDSDIRIVTDHDTVNDITLEAGATDVFESNDEGVVELRELGGDDQQDDDEREQA